MHRRLGAISTSNRPAPPAGLPGGDPTRAEVRFLDIQGRLHTIKFCNLQNFRILASQPHHPLRQVDRYAPLFQRRQPLPMRCLLFQDADGGPSGSPLTGPSGSVYTIAARGRLTQDNRRNWRQLANMTRPALFVIKAPASRTPATQSAGSAEHRRKRHFRRRRRDFHRT